MNGKQPFFSYCNIDLKTQHVYNMYPGKQRFIKRKASTPITIGFNKSILQQCGSKVNSVTINIEKKEPELLDHKP